MEDGDWWALLNHVVAAAPGERLGQRLLDRVRLLPLSHHHRFPIYEQVGEGLGWGGREGQGREIVGVGWEGEGNCGCVLERIRELAWDGRELEGVFGGKGRAVGVEVGQAGGGGVGGLWRLGQLGW